MRWRNPWVILWCVSYVASLLWSTVYCESEPHPTLRAECAVMPGMAMVLLSFPMGLVWLVFISALSYLLHEVGWDTDVKLPSQIGTLTVWLGFSLFGYLQWFKLLPYTIGRIKARRERSARK